jgi:hypothetical protein
LAASRANIQHDIRNVESGLTLFIQPVRGSISDYQSGVVWQLSVEE